MCTLQANLGPHRKHIGWRGLYPCPKMGRGKEAGQGSVSWKGWKSGVEMQPEIIRVPSGRFPAQAQVHLVLLLQGREHPHKLPCTGRKIGKFSPKGAEQGDAASFRV